MSALDSGKLVPGSLYCVWHGLNGMSLLAKMSSTCAFPAITRLWKWPLAGCTADNVLVTETRPRQGWIEPRPKPDQCDPQTSGHTCCDILSTWFTSSPQTGHLKADGSSLTFALGRKQITMFTNLQELLTLKPKPDHRPQLQKLFKQDRQKWHWPMVEQEATDSPSLQFLPNAPLKLNEMKHSEGFS